MLSVGRGTLNLCEGVSRREWIRAGALGAAGLALPQLLAGSASASAHERGFGRAKSCILLFLFGAPAHQDLWDLKPDAPAEFRGEFKPIPTNVSGIQVGEHLPLTARQAHRMAIVRSVTHPDNTHTVAMHYMLTGRRHAEPNTNPQNKPGDFPTFGAVMRYLEKGQGVLPAGVSLNAPANQVSANNHIFPGFFAGLIGSRYDPLFVSQDPNLTGFKPFQPPAGLTDDRLLRRGELLKGVEEFWRRTEPSLAGRSYDDHHRRALELTLSAESRAAWDLERETPGTRERYGRHPFGQGLLLSRRLVQAGVRLVTVNWMRDDAFWDTHSNNFNLLKTSLIPPFDRAFSALLDDLSERGMLEDTLVVVLGEFGRTPQINKSAGRDHWAACNSVVFAGGGISGGQVYGASDAHAAYPASDAVTPEDVAATMYHSLGVDLATELRDSLGRPLPLCGGAPILPLYS